MNEGDAVRECVGELLEAAKAAGGRIKPKMPDSAAALVAVLAVLKEWQAKHHRPPKTVSPDPLTEAIQRFRREAYSHIGRLVVETPAPIFQFA